MAESILQGSNVTKHFGGLTAVMKLDFSVRQGEIHGLIGPNGAGKTTLLNCISGFYRHDSGVIQFKGRDISKCSPPGICSMGIARTFQIPRYFPDETVLDNVTAGVVFGGSSVSRRNAKRDAAELLEFTELSEKKGSLAKELPIPGLKRLGIAIALATKPELLLLDEPIAGLNPTETVAAMELVKRIRSEWNITVLMVEHNMKVIMNICDHITVINFGEKICEGPPEEVGSDAEVIKAYLGEKYVL
jgi:branched-chain amino acid transport system ATP-binding protein